MGSPNSSNQNSSALFVTLLNITIFLASFSEVKKMFLYKFSIRTATSTNAIEVLWRIHPPCKISAHIFKIVKRTMISKQSYNRQGQANLISSNVTVL